MCLKVSSLTPKTYKVTTPVYQGPLDLLLRLIERAELDITKLALAQVTDQFLEHLRSLPESSAEEVSAFLAIAARLLQIKSEILLPRPVVREQGEEDPGDALARQLRMYKRFKELSGFLAELESASRRTYPRLAPAPRIEARYDLNGLTIDDLIAAARSAFSREDAVTELDSVVSPPRITIREKISLIADYLRLHKRGTFQQLLPGKPIRLDVVVTFLALLELVKRHLIQARQVRLFGDIEFESEKSWGDEHDSFELEFDD